MQPSWLPTLLLIPFLYGIGWLLAQPIARPGWSAEDVSLLGTLFSFLLFLVVLPSWIQVRWRVKHPWSALGLRGGRRAGRPPLVQAFFGGLLWAILLLVLIVVPILIGSWGHWLGEASISRCVNALLLMLGVGLAEELIFRGWLWEELDQLLGGSAGVVGQALIFSLVHTRFNLGLMPMLGLLTGLFLLGLALAVRRRLDQGSLWGCIGLHGGLVAGWHLIESGLLQLSPDVPVWLAGPGGLHPNPLGGAVAIAALFLLLLVQFTAVAKAARPVSGARETS